MYVINSEGLYYPALFQTLLTALKSMDNYFRDVYEYAETLKLFVNER